MKRVKWYLGLLLVSILLFVGGCAEEPSPPVLPVTPTPYSSISIPIEEFPNHPHIDVVMHAVVGEELVVTLGSNPTTGFQCELIEITDQTVLKHIDNKYMPPPERLEPIEGEAGEEVWTFEGLKEGSTTIFLEYSRPWECGEKGVWSVTITATIK